MDLNWITQLPVGELIESLGALLGSGADFVQWTDPTYEQFTDDFGRISPAINQHVLGLADYLMEFGMKHANKMTSVGRALGAVFAVIIAGKEAYKVMAENKGFDILAIMRPVLFAFILAFWGPVVQTVTWPGTAIESHFRGVYETINHRTDSLRSTRAQTAWNLDKIVKEARAKQKMEEQAMSQGSSSWWDKILDAGQEAWQWMVDKGRAVIATADTVIVTFFERIIVWIGETAFTVAIYIVFLIKALFITVLAMFGPIYMAASILPAWKDAWKQWVERIVTTSLYGAMAYLAMAFSLQLICYALEQDINALMAFAEDDGIGTFFQFSSGLIGTTCMHAVTYFVGCFAMLAVPEMATLAFPGHTSMAASSFISGLGGKVAKHTGL